MKAWLRWIRVVCPPAFFVIFAALLYLIAWLPILVFWYLGLPEDNAFHASAILVLTSVSAAYGAYRVAVFHPAQRKNYREWLRRTPWTDRHELPLGPVHMLWQDVLVLCGIELLMLVHVVRIELNRGLGVLADMPLDWSELMLLPILAFLIGHVSLVAAQCVMTEVFGVAYWLLLGKGVVVYWLSNIPLATSIATGLYLVALIGIRRSLTAVWIDLSGCDQDKAPGDIDRQATLGWPYRGVGPVDVDELADWRREGTRFWLETALLSGLLGWWLFVILTWCARLDPSLAVAWNERPLLAVAVFTFFALLAAGIRLAIYCLGYRSPISLWGRIMTGRWMIRGHDQVYLAPVAMVLIGIGSVVLQHAWGVSLPLAMSVGVATFIWLGLVLGPDFRTWQLTGNHRLAPMAFNPLRQTKTGTG